MAVLDIAVVSDVVCPWCYIGHQRLSQALDGLEIETSVSFLPFLLDATLPPEGADLRASLRRRYGADPEAMFRRVEGAAAEAGLTLDFARVTRWPSTIGAHTLIRHAEPRGTQRGLVRALFEAYFVDGLDVGEAAVLARVAAPHGFEADEVTRLVADATEQQTTRAMAEALAEQGVRGVPTFVFGQRLAVSGAQPVEVLRRAIREAAAHGDAR